MARALVLNREDNVGTLVDGARKGDEVKLSGAASGTVRLATDIAYGHKVATRAIARGETILKYGIVIGRATAAIGLGEHVHVHNVESLRARGDKDVAAPGGRDVAAPGGRELA